MQTRSSSSKIALLSIGLIAIVTLILSGCGGSKEVVTPKGPKFISSNISPDAVDVPINTKIILTFDQPLQYCFFCLYMGHHADKSIGFEGYSMPIYIADGWNHVINGANVEYTYTYLLSEYTTYSYTVDETSAENFNSVSGAAKVGPFYFTTGGAADIIPPTILNFLPIAANGTFATGVVLKQTLLVNFDKAMDPVSINSTTFTVTDPNNNAVNGVVTYSGVTGMFTPNTSYSPLTKYTVTINTGVKDTKGNSMVNKYSWSFMTGSTPDTLPPTVVKSTPASNAIDVVLGQLISVQFSENISSASNFVVSDGAVNIPGSVSIYANTANFSPSGKLVGNKLYTASISGVKDLSGNALATPYTWQFTTIPLLVTSVIPALNSTNVKIDSSITVNFDRPINVATVTTGTISTSPPIAGKLYTQSSQIVFIPSVPFQSNVTYTVTVANTVTDQSGAPIASNYSWGFTTAPAITPVIVNVTPGDLSMVDSPSVPIVATFSKPLNAATCTTATFTVSGVVGTVTCVGNAATFQPTSPLANGTTYTGTITTGLTDFENLPLVGNYVWSFSTRSQYIPPYVIGTLRTGNWNTPTMVNVEFSLPISAAPSFLFTPSVAGTVTTSGNFVTFTSSAPLTPEVAYSLSIMYARDTVGNTQTPYSTNFVSDTGIVEPVETYAAAGANCAGSATPNSALSVYARNLTGSPKDITICINSQSTYPPPCQTFLNVANGATTTTNNTYAPAYYIYSPVYACWSSGDYAITWNTPNAPAASAKTDKYIAPNWYWTPNTPPPLNPCLFSGVIAVKGCQIPPAILPVTSTPTAPAPASTYAAVVSSATAPDVDGCYVPTHNPDCLVIEKLYLKTDNTGVARLRNNCPQRVVVSSCFQRTNLTWDCGQDSALPGGAIPMWTYNSNGNFLYQFTGSTKWSADWICANSSRDPNWINKFPQ